MKVLVVGSGGREHALVWKLAQSPTVDRIYCAPGNAGMARQAELVDVHVDDVDALCRFASDQAIDLTIVGPELPLVNGIVDLFEAHRCPIVGPTALAARLEGSKVFAKRLMEQCDVPTAAFQVFDDVDAARVWVRSHPHVVIKADGLCAGKGVIVCHDEAEALEGLERILVRREFGDAGNRVIIEERLEGEEASIMALVDGSRFVLLASSQDHKPIGDGDTGPNTGGMGAYSPAPVMTPELEHLVSDRVIGPLVQALAEDGIPYKGVLYAGLMMTEQGPQVLEFNCRFGDPEAQAILPRWQDDIAHVLEMVARGDLSSYMPSWSPSACVCVVMASGGYPGPYDQGLSIDGLDAVETMADVMVFHAGTKFNVSSSGEPVNDAFVTAGGRVLGVTALGQGIDTAVQRAYEAAGQIHFTGAYYRQDIGSKALATYQAEL